jgi:hypothetical protein
MKQQSLESPTFSTLAILIRVFKALVIFAASYLGFCALLIPVTNYFAPSKALIVISIGVPLIGVLTAILLSRSRWRVVFLYILLGASLFWLYYIGLYQHEVEAARKFQAAHGYSYPTFIVRQLKPGMTREEVHDKLPSLGRTTFSGYRQDTTGRGSFTEDIFFQVTPLSYPECFAVTYNAQNEVVWVLWMD